MASNKKKRLSFYDFFGKSSPGTSSSKNSKTHTRSTSDTSKSSSAQARHRLTFNIPDESIVSNIDVSHIPSPLPKQRNKRLSLQADPVATGGGLTASKNTTSLPRSKAKDTDGSKLSKDTQNNEARTTVYKDVPKNTTDRQASSRQVSTTSVSSSVYPNENTNIERVSQSRTPSNSTLPDFSRQSSSIYPPSTIAPLDVKQGLRPSSTVKRSDLLRKRKPPPLTVKTRTSTDGEINPPEVSMKSSVTGSRNSSDSEFSPLHLLPVANGSENFKSGPLGPAKQLNPSKNVMFVETGIEYNPPSINSEQYAGAGGDTDNNNTNNTHKHSRTLSSIEEITSALNKFQIEHEKSFQSYGSSDHKADSTTNDLSFGPSIVSDAPTIEQTSYKEPEENDMVLTAAVGTHDELLLNEKLANNNIDVANSESNGIFLKVKDLPELEEGQTMTDYVEKLKNIPEVAVNGGPNGGINSYKDMVNLGKPKSANDSETSSTSDVFFDVVETKENEYDQRSNSNCDGSIQQSIESKHLVDGPVSGADLLSKNENDIKGPAILEDKEAGLNILTGEYGGSGSMGDSKEEHRENVHESASAGADKSASESANQGANELGNTERAVEAENRDENACETKRSLELSRHSLGSSADIYDDSTGDAKFYLGEDLIGPLDESFESFVKQTMSSTNEDTQSQTPCGSTVSDFGEDASVDDGDWQRYSSATNFFNDAALLDDGQLLDDDESLQQENIVTPIDEPDYSDMEQQLKQRNFDLDDELDNNVTEIKEIEKARPESLADFYPTDSDSEYVDYGDENEGTEEGEGEEKNLENGRYDEDGNKIRATSDVASFNTSKDRSPKGSNDSEDISNGNFINGAGIGMYSQNCDELCNSKENSVDSNEGILEFSPKSPSSFNSSNQTPDLYRHNSMCSKGLLQKITNSQLVGTPTGLGIGRREHLVVTNGYQESPDTNEYYDSIDDESVAAPIPGLEDNDSLSFNGTEEVATRDEPASTRSADERVDTDTDENPKKVSIYDRREQPTVIPIQHSLVVTPAAPTNVKSYSTRSRRPPPSHPSTGRRGRGLSESTANPELFTTGLTSQLMTTGDASGSGGTPGGATSGADRGNSHDGSVQGRLAENASSPALELTDSVKQRKGEKCPYVENLRLGSKKTTLSSKMPLQSLPIAIRQNGTISHKKIPSQQLYQTFKAHKHVPMKPKTRMMASEIDDAELPDATLFHAAQKTKVPTHPDAAVIAASEQFNRIAGRRSGGDLGRFNSVMSVRPHYGDGMRLFVTNPDSDEE